MRSILGYCFLFCTINASRSQTDISTSDYCLFKENLKHQLENLRCNLTRLDSCATKARKIAQKNLSGELSFLVVINDFTGNWGAIVVNKNSLINMEVDWFIYTIDPSPSRCRLISNSGLVFDLFRTGYRLSNPHKKKWTWKQNKFEICPISSIHALIDSYSETM
jgi:hypothetical protein